MGVIDFTHIKREECRKKDACSERVHLWMVIVEPV
jgi:hypothetical protein